MADKKLQEILKENIPEYLQNSDNLVAYLEAAGQYLDESRDKITQFDWSRDYKNGSAYNIEQSLLSLGFEIPPLLSDALRRLILRDAIETFIRKGTEDTLIWVLKIMGLEPEVRYAYLPAAEEIKKGYIIDPISGLRFRYSPDQFAYGRFIYGSEVVTSDGVFFEGYTYNDVYRENKLGPYPIVGERYKKPQPLIKEAVAKTPYIIVRVGDQGYNTVTDPYIGSDGQQYEYTPAEAFQVANDLIDYFLYQLSRPANVRIIIVALQEFTPEELAVTETYDDTNVTHPPVDFGDERFTVSEESSFAETTTYPELVIGDIAATMGTELAWENQLSVTDRAPLIGDVSGDYGILPIDEWAVYTTSTYIDVPNAGLSRTIPIRALTSISMEAPADSAVTVRGIFHRTDLNSYDVLGTFQPGESFSFSNDHRYHLIQLDFASSSSKRIKISLRHARA